VIRYYTSGSP